MDAGARQPDDPLHAVVDHRLDVERQVLGAEPHALERLAESELRDRIGFGSGLELSAPDVTGLDVILHRGRRRACVLEDGLEASDGIVDRLERPQIERQTIAVPAIIGGVAMAGTLCRSQRCTGDRTAPQAISNSSGPSTARRKNPFPRKSGTFAWRRSR